MKNKKRKAADDINSLEVCLFIYILFFHLQNDVFLVLRKFENKGKVVVYNFLKTINKKFSLINFKINNF